MFAKFKYVFIVISILLSCRSKQERLLKGRWVNTTEIPSVVFLNLEEGRNGGLLNKFLDHYSFQWSMLDSSILELNLENDSTIYFSVGQLTDSQLVLINREKPSRSWSFIKYNKEVGREKDKIDIAQLKRLLSSELWEVFTKGEKRAEEEFMDSLSFKNYHFDDVESFENEGFNLGSYYLFHQGDLTVLRTDYVFPYFIFIQSIEPNRIKGVVFSEEHGNQNVIYKRGETKSEIPLGLLRGTEWERVQLWNLDLEKEENDIRLPIGITFEDVMVYHFMFDQGTLRLEVGKWQVSKNGKCLLLKENNTSTFNYYRFSIDEEGHLNIRFDYRNNRYLDVYQLKDRFS